MPVKKLAGEDGSQNCLEGEGVCLWCLMPVPTLPKTAPAHLSCVSGGCNVLALGQWLVSQLKGAQLGQGERRGSWNAEGA